MDGDTGKVIWLGKYLLKINNPMVSGIHKKHPAILVHYILKTCWTHFTKAVLFMVDLLLLSELHCKNLDILATHLDDPNNVKYLCSFEHMETDVEIGEFHAWCQNHAVKAV
jgi:hypothetical protein